MKSSFIFALTIVGTLIGAGFATGQELLSFFIIRSEIPVFYFLISSFIMLSVITTIYVFSEKENITNCETLYRRLFGVKLSFLFLIISTLFLFSCFCVTASGTGSLFKDHLNLPYSFGVLTILIITYSTLRFGIKGVLFVNMIITPSIIVSILLIGSLSFAYSKEAFFNFYSVKENKAALLFSLLYFGYNIFSIIPVVLSVNRKNEKKCVITGIVISFLIIVLTGIIMINVISRSNFLTDSYSLPFLNIVADISLFAEKLYLVIMYFAMITTAISCFYGYNENISGYFHINENIPIITGLILAFFTAFFGFTNLVRKVYSFFGIFGVIISLCVMCKICHVSILKNYKKLIKK